MQTRRMTGLMLAAVALAATALASATPANAAADQPTVVGSITVGSGPQGVAVSPDGTRTYVTNVLDNTVSVIDTATDTVSAAIAVGSYPWAAVVSPDGTRLYVANQSGGSVTVIDASTNIPTAEIPVGSPAWGLAVSPDGTRLYVARWSRKRGTLMPSWIALVRASSAADSVGASSMRSTTVCSRLVRGGSPTRVSGTRVRRTVHLTVERSPTASGTATS